MLSACLNIYASKACIEHTLEPMVDLKKKKKSKAYRDVC